MPQAFDNRVEIDDEIVKAEKRVEAVQALSSHALQRLAFHTYLD